MFALEHQPVPRTNAHTAKMASGPTEKAFSAALCCLLMQSSLSWAAASRSNKTQKFQPFRQSISVTLEVLMSETVNDVV
jgi:hypothetical protein